MSNSTSSFADKVLWPMLVLALTPLVTILGSKLVAGDWLAWIQNIPTWVYPSFFGAIFLWLIANFVARRIFGLRKANLPSLPSVFTIPTFGYVTVGKLDHAGVRWLIRVPAQAPWQGFNEESVRPSEFDIGLPPHCPECDTELEESETFFGGYRWSCIRCSFKTKNKINYYREAIRAEKVAKAQWKDEYGK